MTSLAKTRFEDGDKERGRAAVLEVLALLPQLESAGYAEPRLKELVQIHLDCRQTKPATRLAALLDEKIAAQTEPMMRDYRRDDVFATYLRVFDELDSTNAALKRLAEEGAPEGLALIAEAQTQGRGRMGRSF